MLIAPLSATVFSALCVALLLRFAAALPHAHPNARSLHETPRPRVGGLALWAGALPVALAGPLPPGLDPAATTALCAATLAVGAVSLADDWRSVGVALRLGVHLAAAALFALVAFAGAGPWTLAGVALATMWFANLYNFMDGSDGIAGVMTLSGFAAYGTTAWAHGVSGSVPLALAAAALPFLAVNLPPARMFMGDVGAVPAGFLAAALGFAGVRAGLWPAWFPWLVFLPFVADATLTLARRALAGERVWEAHRSHYYQRLNQLGLGHGGTLAVYAALAAGTAVTAFACATWAPATGWLALATWGVVHAVLFAAIDYHWRRRTPSA